MATIPQTTFETIPLGEYLVECDAAEVREGDYGQQVEFSLRIIGGEHDGAILKAWSSAVFNPKSKLYGWATALFGKDIPKDYDLDTAHLVGRRALASVIIKDKDDGTEVNRVQRMRPVKGGQPELPGAASIPGAASPQPGAAIPPEAIPGQSGEAIPQGGGSVTLPW